MPKGPRGEKRPADFVSAAVKVMRIATDQKNDRITRPEDERKDPAAVALGRRGGKTRAPTTSLRRVSPGGCEGMLEEVVGF